MMKTTNQYHHPQGCHPRKPPPWRQCKCPYNLIYLLGITTHLFLTFLMHLTQPPPPLSIPFNKPPPHFCHRVPFTSFTHSWPTPGQLLRKKLTDNHRFQVTTTTIPLRSHLTTPPLYLPQLSTSTTPTITTVWSPATHTYLTNSYVLNKDHNSKLTRELTHKLQTHPLQTHTQTPPVTTLHFPESSVTTPQVPWETSTRLHKRFPFLTPLSHHNVQSVAATI
jgi:hypothetical protein